MHRGPAAYILGPPPSRGRYLESLKSVIVYLSRDIPAFVIGASLSEPHLVRTMISLSLYIIYIYRISSNSLRPPNRPRHRIDRVRRLEASEIQCALELSAQCGQLNLNRL